MPYKDRKRQLDYQAQWMKRRRDAWFRENGPCVDCGVWEDLQLDHVDPKMKVSHRIWSWSTIRREAELAKCVVRCGTCHRQKTFRGREHAYGEAIHGAHDLALVLAVRERRRSSGATYRQMAREFGIPVKTAWNMCKGYWKHLDDPSVARWVEQPLF